MHSSYFVCLCQVSIAKNSCMSHHGKTCHSNSFLANCLHEVHAQVWGTVGAFSGISKRSKLMFGNFLVKVLENQNDWMCQIWTTLLLIPENPWRNLLKHLCQCITYEVVLFFWIFRRHSPVQYKWPGNVAPFATSDARKFKTEFMIGWKPPWIL